jgi:two-component system, LuxR family, sensor kinase FixL
VLWCLGTGWLVLGKIGVQRDHRAPVSAATPATRFDAATLAALGALCGVLALAGWVFDLPHLRGFGIPDFPIWPLTAIGFVALSLGHLAAILGQRRAAAVLWVIPLAVAAASATQAITGGDFGIDRLLFGGLLSQFQAAHPGRPGLNPATILVLLSLAGYLSITRRRSSAEAEGMAIAIAVGVTAVAVFLTFSTLPAIAVLSIRPGDPVAYYRSISIPSAMCAVCVAGAILAQHGSFNWIRLFAVRKGIWRVARLLLPAALVVPLLPPIFNLFFVQSDRTSSLAQELLLLLCNLLAVGIIGYWAASRIARDQAALVELSHALDNATVAVVAADGTIVHWSKGCEQLYGWSVEEARDKNKYALLRSRCELLDHGMPVRNGAGIQQLAETTKDGRELHVLERVHQVESPMRGALLVLGINDISQRVAATEALRASEERLAAAASAHELGIFEWHVPSGRIDWSPGTEQRLGLEPGALSNIDRWQAQVDPADVRDVLETIAQAARDRAEKISFRWRLAHPREVRVVEGSARVFYDGHGKMQRGVGMILDVTARDEREAALRRREVHLQSLLDTVPDAIVVIDAQGQILQFSTAAQKLWGYAPEEVVGRHFTVLAPATEREGIATVLRRFLETGRGLTDRVITSVAQTKDGRQFPVEARTGVAHSDHDLLLTIFLRDLTEQVTAEERLRDLNAEIAHVSRQSAMSELAADLAHELNQPLSAISNFLAAARMLLERGEDPERISELLRLGVEQTQRAGEIIRRLRAFMARGEVEMRTELVDRTVRDAVDLVLVSTGLANIRVNYHLDPDVQFVFADRIQVQQVLVNLLRNAIDALRQSDQKEKIITIVSRRSDDHMIEIAVTDNGPGMPSQVLDNLFSRFTTTKGVGGGMGIGLSISKRIIEAHGGTLRGDNRPEGGACFRFTLPAVEQGETNDQDDLHR